ncbi:bacteriophage antitermination protein Q [Vibrio parahaemolyticus]
MIKQQTLSFVREEIISALSADARTAGQLDFDASAITNYGRRIRRIDDITGQRIDSDPVRGSSSRTYKTSSCPLPHNAFWLSKITRAVTMLPDNLNSLALFAYAERCDWHHVETVSCELWATFLDAQEKALREKKKQKLKGMVYLAMQNWKSLLLTDREAHEPARVRELIGVSEQNWRRDWLPYWRQMHDLLSKTDEKVLVHVYRETSRKTAMDQKQTAAA